MTKHLRRFLPLAALLLAASSMVACDPPALPPTWQISDVRVVAMRAEPPEIAPGDSTTLSVLIGNPRDEPLSLLWFPCVDQGGFGCADLGFGEDTPTDLLPQFGDTFTYTAAGESFDPFWDELSAEERIEGLAVAVNLIVIREDPTTLQAAFFQAFAEGEDAVSELFDRYLGDALVAVKRVQVSEPGGAETDPSVECFGLTEIERNKNPTPRGTDWRRRSDDTSPPAWWFPVPEEDIVVKPGERIDIWPRIYNPDIEQYLFVDSNGNTECRREEPYFAWLAEGGTLSTSYSFTPSVNPAGSQRRLVWQAPQADEWPLNERIRIWHVVRDRRGGIGWSPLWFRFEPNIATSAEAGE